MKSLEAAAFRSVLPEAQDRLITVISSRGFSNASHRQKKVFYMEGPIQSRVIPTNIKVDIFLLVWKLPSFYWF